MLLSMQGRGGKDTNHSVIILKPDLET
nr:unnamed protein product [Callosobruchus chinensis]